jgi:hypothetical protein
VPPAKLGRCRSPTAANATPPPRLSGGRPSADSVATARAPADRRPLPSVGPNRTPGTLPRSARRHPCPQRQAPACRGRMTGRGGGQPVRSSPLASRLKSGRTKEAPALGRGGILRCRMRCGRRNSICHNDRPSPIVESGGAVRTRVPGSRDASGMLTGRNGQRPGVAQRR